MGASNVVSDWIESEPVGRGSAALARSRIVRPNVSEPNNIDRYHNNESLSPEAMAEALADLKDTVAALEARLAVAEAGSESAVGATKDLGLTMLHLGDALSKRMTSLEEVAATPAPEPADEWFSSAELMRGSDEVLSAPPPAEEVAAPLFAPAPVADKRTSKARTLRLSLGLGAALLAAVAAVYVMRPHAAPAPPAQVLYSAEAPAPN